MITAAKSSTPTLPAGEIPALTSLRMLAALLVFLYHFPPRSSGVAALVGREGHVGVTVFFVLSGFLITVRYSDSLGQGRVSLRGYFGKRAARILPLYFAVLGLSLLMAGRPLFTLETLPEWTLTHGFFARSLEHLTVPTSWTLSIEECFYALAPVVFFTLRHGARRPGAVLLGWTAALAGAGLLCFALSRGGRFGFLGSAPEIVIHTVFFRFADFALGIASGLLFLSGRVSRTWERPGGLRWASAGALAGALAIVAAEAGMFRAGGIAGDSWAAAWPWNVLVIVGSAVLILCLTARASLVSRILAFAPFVYLGRISYSLYLVQMTPLGKGLLYRILPGDSPWFVPALYVGMSAISALLYELVEEPGRRAVTRLLAPESGRAGAPRTPILPAAATTLVVACALAVQATAWSDAHLSERHGAPSLSEVERAVGRESTRILVVPRAEPAATDRVRLPDQWMLGALPDQRAPRSLLVFVDGQTVPFQRVPPAADEIDDESLAYYRRPRTQFVELHLADPRPAEIVVVRHDAALAIALYAGRLLESRATLVAWALLVAAAAATAAALLPFRRLRGRAALVLATLTVLALATGLLERDAAPAVIAVEMAALLVLRQRAAAPPASSRGPGVGAA